MSSWSSRYCLPKNKQLISFEADPLHQSKSLMNKSKVDGSYYLETNKKYINKTPTKNFKTMYSITKL